MKKTRLLSLITMLILVSILAIGCKNSSKDSSKKSSGGGDSIVGTWTMNLGDSLEDMGGDMGDIGISLDMELTYVFNEDGTGSLSALGQTVDILYEVDGDELTLTIKSEDGESETESGKFSINGDTLTIYSKVEGENDAVFKRVK